MPDLVEVHVTDATAHVWASLFELGPDELATVPDLVVQLAPSRVQPRTVAYAVERAADARLVAREDLRTAGGAVRWRRSILWPPAARRDAPPSAPFTLEQLLAGGAERAPTLAILDALVLERFLELSARGYEVRPL